jgi:hypothetical protein
MLNVCFAPKTDVHPQGLKLQIICDKLSHPIEIKDKVPTSTNVVFNIEA